MDDRYERVVHEAWEGNPLVDPMVNVLEKIKSCQSQLQLWDKKLFGNVCITLAKKKKLLEKAETNSTKGRNLNLVKSLSEEIKMLSELEGCLWRHRSYLKWLKEGDCNSKYFHCRATERNKRNFITGLENQAGVLIKAEGQIGRLLTQYYTGLFTSSNPSGFDLVHKGVKSRVSNDMNDELLRSFKEIEVLDALNQMDSSSTPGLDGLSPMFYKQF